MATASGKRLGPYEVTGVVGAGGMGEVYRARDPRLGRDVAIKVLPASVVTDGQRLRRFEQEARAAAALNHPNILAVHDIGSDNGAPYIVSELLDGETLRERLRGGPLPVRKAVDFAQQIARALGAAHDKGIVHRDLKPENIFITKDGRVKILDFGLAKLKRPEGREDRTGTANFGEDSGTAPGTVMGTVGYMSPEQVRGEAAGPASDLFSFGAVLYEMLSGMRAFKGASPADTLSAILKDDPPELTQSNVQVPTALEHIVRHCLEKRPEERFHSAHDIAFDLQLISTASGTAEAQTAPTPGPVTQKRRLGVGAIGVLLIAICGAYLLMWAAFPLFRSQPPKYRQLTFRRGYIIQARFAPDGQTIIYDAGWDRPPARMYTMRADGTDVRSVDLPASSLAAVSHTGELAVLLYSAPSSVADRLARAPLTGGAPHEVLDDVFAADWSPDGSQLAVARFVNGKCRLEYPPGKPLYETVGFVNNVRVSPSGDAIAVMDHPIRGDDRGTVAMIDTRGNKRVLTHEWNGEEGLAWSPDGHEIWFTATEGADYERALYAVSKAGKQRLILRVPGSLELKDIGADGRVLFSRNDRRFEVVAGEVGGRSRQLSWLQMMVVHSVSRDGKFAAITDTGSYEIYLAKLDGSPPVFIGRGIGAGISPDDKWVAAIQPTDNTELHLLPTGMGEAKTIGTPNFHYKSAAWASDGRGLVISASESNHPLRVWAQNLDGTPPRPLTPEGTDGTLLTVNHTGYVVGGILGEGKNTRLYPLDGSTPLVVDGLQDSDSVVGGTPDSEFLYVTPDLTAIPMQIWKLNIRTGRRERFTAIVPGDTAGIAGLGPPKFTEDGKRYVQFQARELSTLYLASGLK